MSIVLLTDRLWLFVPVRQELFMSVKHRCLPFMYISCLPFTYIQNLPVRRKAGHLQEYNSPVYGLRESSVFLHSFPCHVLDGKLEDVGFWSVFYDVRLNFCLSGHVFPPQEDQFLTDSLWILQYGYLSEGDDAGEMEPPAVGFRYAIGQDAERAFGFLQYGIQFVPPCFAQ